MSNNIFFLVCLSYLIGSIPFAYILPKIFGFGDIRNIGSGNVGTTNVLRTSTKSFALIVLSLDILKGYLPLLIFKLYFLQHFSDLTIYAISSSAIIGHLFPFWLKFKGGKGVATYIGYLFSINYLLGLIFVFSWLIIAIIKKMLGRKHFYELTIFRVQIYT